LRGDAGGVVEVDSTWIHLGPDARPARIGEGFDGYAEAAQGRTTSTKLTLAPPPVDEERRRWPLRLTDVDRMGHVNNAAYWAAVEQRLADVGIDPRQPLRARLDYRHPIDLDEPVDVAELVDDDGYAFAFVVDTTVRAVGRVDPFVPSHETAKSFSARS
jgi:acyl-ACP thioesterase